MKLAACLYGKRYMIKRNELEVFFTIFAISSATLSNGGDDVAIFHYAFGTHRLSRSFQVSYRDLGQL